MPPEPWTCVIPTWCGGLVEEQAPPGLVEALEQADQHGTLCPNRHQIWGALEGLSPHKVRVVIVGQDPYHGQGQAHGLAFSVGRPGLRRPPSLRNILEECAADVGTDPQRSNDLSDWVSQGVLLLNTVLTTTQGQAGAHQGMGWETVTRNLLLHVAKSKPRLVWILWGKPAQNLHDSLVQMWLESGVDRSEDLVLRSSHPSPLSAHRGFRGSRPFSATNRALRAWGEAPIHW